MSSSSSYPSMAQPFSMSHSAANMSAMSAGMRQDAMGESLIHLFSLESYHRGWNWRARAPHTFRPRSSSKCNYSTNKTGAHYAPMHTRALALNFSALEMSIPPFFSGRSRNFAPLELITCNWKLRSRRRGHLLWKPISIVTHEQTEFFTLNFDLK